MICCVLRCGIGDASGHGGGDSDDDDGHYRLNFKHSLVIAFDGFGADISCIRSIVPPPMNLKRRSHSFLRR